MKILSHRGLSEQNSIGNSEVGLVSAIKDGFGIETDLRDFENEVVISHDPATRLSLPLNLVLKRIVSSQESVVALNIKADGLAEQIAKLLPKEQRTNFFCFDMSVPDMMSYIAVKLPVFTRQSEFEKIPVFYEASEGIWLDSFKSDWFTNDVIWTHLSTGKKVAVVSPELHKRDHRHLWRQLLPFSSNENVMLCTDFPIEARKFFR